MDKAKSLGKKAAEAEVEIAKDPRSKARNVKTQQTIKKELAEEKVKQVEIGKKIEQKAKEGEEAGLTKKQAEINARKKQAEEEKIKRQKEVE